MITPLRIAVAAICVIGIAGMIIGSIADNNNGAVVTFGLITAVSIVVLIAVTASAARSATGPPAVGEEEMAAELEARIAAMVEAGSDETAVRDLVGRAVQFGRKRSSRRAPDR